MQSKQVLFRSDARGAILRGASALADAVRVTLGPKFKCVLMDKTFGRPLLCNGHVTIANEMELKKPVENLGAEMIREAAEQTSDAVGDGTTASTLLVHAMYAQYSFSNFAKPPIRNRISGALASASHNFVRILLTSILFRYRILPAKPEDEMKTQSWHAFWHSCIGAFILFTGSAYASTSTTDVFLNAMPNPAVFGNPVTLNVTVSPATATGKVSFYDGVTVLGVAGLSSGSATLTTLLLSAGTHSLRARYNGDAKHQASLSPIISETVNAVKVNGFKSIAESTVLGPGALSRPAIADFNGDGNLDMVVLRQAAVVNGFRVGSGTLNVLLGDGNGRLTVGISIPTGTQSGFGTPIAGDFNGDGHTDIVFAEALNDSSGEWAIALWLGDGQGGFTEALGSPFFQGNTNIFGGLGALAAADFNEDGNLDLAFTGIPFQGQQSVHVWLGNGKGGFPTKLGPFPLRTGGFPTQAAAVDFNGDGHADLVTASVFTGFELLLGDGTGVLKSASGQASEIFGGYDMAVCDFNGDGKSDIALTGDSKISIVLGNGTASISRTIIPVNNLSFNIGCGDFNGDGKTDLVSFWLYSNFNPPVAGVQIMYGDGKGGFGAPVRFNSFVRGQPSIAVADFNGNGKPDLALIWSSVINPLFLGDNVLPPKSIAAFAGSPQSIPNDSAFNPPLEAVVRDSASNPLSNALVVFNSAAALGFPIPSTTDPNGIAKLTGPVHFSSTGRYTVRATTTGVAGQADFVVNVLPENVSAGVSYTSTGFLYSRVSRTYSGTLQITVNSWGPYGFWAPVQVVHTGLPAGVTLNNAAGNYKGDPYFVLQTNAQNYSVPLSFSGLPGVTIQFKPVFYMGAFQ